MRSLLRFGSACLTALVLYGPVAAAAEPVLLQPGQPAPSAGVFLPAGDDLKVAEALRTRALDEADRAALESQGEARLAEIRALREALMQASVERQLMARELALKDQIIELRRGLNDEYGALLEHARKTIEVDRQTIARLETRIDKLENRMFWLQLLSPIGLAIGVFSGGIFH